jgi:hypothetical protein
MGTAIAPRQHVAMKASMNSRYTVATNGAERDNYLGHLQGFGAQLTICELAMAEANRRR